MFGKFAAGDKKAIHPNIRGSVYAIVLEDGGEKEVRFGMILLEPETNQNQYFQYDVILNAYRTSTNSDEKNTALRSLGRSTNPKCIQRSLDLALSSEVKEQDVSAAKSSTLPLLLLKIVLGLDLPSYWRPSHPQGRNRGPMGMGSEKLGHY